MMRFEVVAKREGFGWNMFTESGSYYGQSAQVYSNEAGVIRSLRKQFGSQGNTLVRTDGRWTYL